MSSFVRIGAKFRETSHINNRHLKTHCFTTEFFNSVSEIPDLIVKFWNPTRTLTGAKVAHAVPVEVGVREEESLWWEHRQHGLRVVLSGSRING